MQYLRPINTKYILIKSMNNLSKNKATLSQKLNKKKGVKVFTMEDNKNVITPQIPDIEDSFTIKSKYFSPIRTRQQRKTTEIPIKMRELTNLKRTKNALSKNEPLIKKEFHNVKEVDINKKINIKKEILEYNEDIKPSTSAISIKKEETGKNETENTIWEPKDWVIFLENIRKMRLQSVAPVDVMGCDRALIQNLTPEEKRFHILLSLMMSSQTKDETTHAALQRLIENTTHLTPTTICEMPTTQLENLLHPVSFYKTKAKHIQKTSQILIDQYNSDIPKNIEELIKLPGVGPKMAHLAMSCAWNIVTGIGVDVHVHRISNRLRWVENETKEPEKTRIALEKWLPRALWKEINHLFVGFGQTICTPLRPKCNSCLNVNICPSANMPAPVKTKKLMVKKEKKIIL